ncbi:MAG TPA: RHS repeat-associated core domain-containing protein, partial [Chitinophagaceae bacterium]|nr:RHS repeat-associated core domain-containing protein [Chitinophagaceae bacterium]
MRLKTFSFVLFLLFTTVFSHAQQNIISRILAKDSSLAVFRRPHLGDGKYVIAAVINKHTKVLYYITRYAEVTDSFYLTDNDFTKLLGLTASPFDYVKTAEDKIIPGAYRVEMLLRRGEKINANVLSKSSVSFCAAPLLSKISTLEKINLLDMVVSKLLFDEWLIDTKDPKELREDNNLYLHYDNGTPGTMIKKPDTTIYYNENPVAWQYKAILLNKTAKILYYNRNNNIIDSIAIRSKQVPELLKEKTDVFLLYKGWLEIQLRWAEEQYTKLDLINKTHQAILAAANLPPDDEPMVNESLYSAARQLADIIDRLQKASIPDAKAIATLMHYAYKDARVSTALANVINFYITSYFTRGNKRYELTDHRGNVMVTIADTKTGHDAGNGTVSYYTPDVVSANDYYPGGMLMPGRTYTSGNNSYRYGFNGKELDKEVMQYDYGFRIYDPRLVRFKSVDPIAKEYPGLTTYQFASNRPIQGIDKEGKEFAVNNWLWDIWMDWEFGDPTGIKSLKSGYEEKTAIATHRMSYNNKNVPEDVQNTLDKSGTLDANIKIGKGISRLTTFNIKTSFDLLSSVAPLGEALEVSLKGAEIVYGGIRAERVLVGSSEKIAVIGRDFDARVLKFAAGFEKQTGTKVETFVATEEEQVAWKGLLKEYNGHVPKDIVKQSAIYKHNERWAQKIKKEGYKVLDTGLGTQDG